MTPRRPAGVAALRPRTKSVRSRMQRHPSGHQRNFCWLLPGVVKCVRRHALSKASLTGTTVGRRLTRQVAAHLAELAEVVADGRQEPGVRLQAALVRYALILRRALVRYALICAQRSRHGGDVAAALHRAPGIEDQRPTPCAVWFGISVTGPHLRSWQAGAWLAVELGGKPFSTSWAWCAIATSSYGSLLVNASTCEIS